MILGTVGGEQLDLGPHCLDGEERRKFFFLREGVGDGQREREHLKRSAELDVGLDLTALRS